MKNIFTFTLALVVIFQSQRAISQTKSTTSNIDELIETRLKETGIVGLGAAIIVDKKLVWTKGYGYADRDLKTPFTPNTIMNVASTAKAFTGVSLMRLVEENKISLDEDINTYLPFKVINPNFPNEKITLRHLATHTSGLIDRYPFYDSTYVVPGKPRESLGEFLKNYFVPGGKYYSKDNFLKSKPGTYRSYGNFGAGLAGYIVELRTGKKLNEYTKKYIFNPLKMDNSGWFLSEVNVKNHTKLYNKEGKDIKQIDLYEGITYPDGGLRTTVNELSRFFIALLNEGVYGKTSILKKESVKNMLQFQHTPINKPENVNLDKLNSGIFWATKIGATTIGHNGSDPGVRVFMLSDLNKEVAVIFFANTSLTDSEEGVYFDIYEDLYKYGLTLKKAQTN
ncbi:beta-lactamase family protein [Pedobacter polaris]|uniref:Beta-lactamase family protein n=1 Tax=Pedobacter polaris TaxID=2571273 RepID=A0A4U1CQL4_9SPHI|nr:serine hydrolase domain-containing protein [Pedobacter polaris]TKC10301.1 beta-lactamase family protein [Pedobacter polaris]